MERLGVALGPAGRHYYVLSDLNTQYKLMRRVPVARGGMSDVIDYPARSRKFPPSVQAEDSSQLFTSCSVHPIVAIAEIDMGADLEPILTLATRNVSLLAPSPSRSRVAILNSAQPLLAPRSSRNSTDGTCEFH